MIDTFTRGAKAANEEEVGKLHHVLLVEHLEEERRGVGRPHRHQQEGGGGPRGRQCGPGRFCRRQGDAGALAQYAEGRGGRSVRRGGVCEGSGDDFSFQSNYGIIITRTVYTPLPSDHRARSRVISVVELSLRADGGARRGGAAASSLRLDDDGRRRREERAQHKLRGLARRDLDALVLCGELGADLA